MTSKALEKIPTTTEVQTALARFEGGLTLQEDGLIIRNSDEAALAGVKLRSVKSDLTELDNLLKTMTAPMNQALKAAREMFARPKALLQRSELNLKNAIQRFQQEQENMRRAEEAKLREAQRKEQEKADAKALALRAKGKDERADAVLAAVPSVPTVILADNRLDGISMRKTWKAEVTDIVALVAYIADHSEMLQFIVVNESQLNAFARSTAGAVPLPGVHFYQAQTVAARGE